MSTLSVRRPLSVVAVLAMVATMLFAVAGTASAAIATPSETADYSACPSNAGIPDAGFTDIPTASFFDDAVNCLAYYGVTQGTSATTYGAGDDLTRAQLALFLARSAAAAGVVLLASPPSAGFTDIGALSAEAQLAINQLADVGIVKGKTATTFAPADTVWRQQMALFLTRFLDKAVQGPGGSTLAAATDTSPFTDIGQTTVEASTAINQAWDLGIAAGTTDTTFDPLGNVNRGQMSLFLTRLYAHANTRPAGVNIQAKPVSGFDALTPNLSATHRDSSFLPTLNTSIDVFEFTAGTGLTPFNSNGTCNDVQSASSSSSLCSIATGDLVTNANGNLVIIVESVGDGDTVTYYAWTGASGATFDEDTTAHSLVTVGSTTGHTTATFTTDVNEFASGQTANPVVKFGQTVTYTVQLVDADDDPVAEAGVSFTFMDVKTVEGVPVGTTYWPVLTDATGKATYQVTQSDPDTATNNTSGDDKNVVTVPAGEYIIGSAITVKWNDDAPAAFSVIAATPTEYKIQSDGAANSATATLYDQYGDTMTGKVINFTSTATGDLNEVQTITSDGTGGTFTLTFGGQPTGNIDFDAPTTGPGSVQEALEALSNIGVGNVAVTGSVGNWVVTFQGALAAQDVLLIIEDEASLTKPATLGITLTLNGSSGVNQIQTIDSDGTDGTFRLEFVGDTTGLIDYDADATTVKSALDLLGSIIAVGGVGVAGGPGPGDDWVVTFTTPGDVLDISVADNQLTKVANVTVTPTDGESKAAGVGITAIPRTTNSAGVATFAYTWNWASPSVSHAAMETVTATSVVGNKTGTAEFYWVDAADDGDTIATGAAKPVLVADVANDTVVADFGSDDYKSWTWESGDQFNTGAGSGSATTQAAFETAIAASGADLAVTPYVGSGTGVSKFFAQP